MPKRTELNQDLDAKYGFRPSTIEDIDRALYNFVNDDLNIFCNTNEGFRKVPVLFASPERAFSIKDDPDLRKNGRTLEYPLISIVRGQMINNPSNKGKYGVYIPPYLVSIFRHTSAFTSVVAQSQSLAKLIRRSQETVRMRRQKRNIIKVHSLLIIRRQCMIHCMSQCQLT
jgi:hypothetical protein